MSDKIQKLEAELREKERVVSALTERLEQAAEQLDRFRRTGADRGARTSGGLPTELIANHEQLVGQMQQAVESWESAQPTDTLARIESGIESLTSLVREQLENISAGAAAFDSTRSAGTPLDADAESESEGAADEELEEPEVENGKSSWEQLKDQLMHQQMIVPDGSDDGLEALAANDSSESDSSSQTGGLVADANGQSVADDLAEPDQVEAPAPIDLSTASDGDMRRAIEARDAYVTFLIQKLRITELRCDRFAGWSKLESLPEELHAELTQLQKSLQDHLRLAEVELAVERARIGREAARLEQVEAQFRKQMEQMEESSDNKADPEGAVSRRWLKFLNSKGS